ncbi:type IV toxin-antitoxin system AbiEi family antitoxin domain-containing protein [Williamsia deligens]|uniref:DUF559 domain-containing protein n=1 Tax=Williamsia deligens TaxID=321325 RepID=A0ABW3G8I3_9NOCA|nr:type IV toxin-antitoxin system AbiEi family antitoxin domain-containing protein [Williamsia deligens]MCP2192478.1 Protein of unknown function (DUF559) [Williamsia deligens]
MTMNAAVRDVLAAHDGVITRREALEAGLSSSAIGRLVAGGRWRAVAGGVYMATDRAMTDRSRLRLACEAVGDRAVLGGLASMWWQGAAERAPQRVVVVAPRGRRGRVVVGTVILQRELHPEDIATRGGLRVMALPFAAVEAAANEGAVDAFDRALLRRQIDLADAVAAHERYPGRRGAGAAERILAAASGGARSEAERITHQLLRRARIHGWAANVEVSGYVGDIVFREAKVIVEIDGFAFHTDPGAFQRDRERRNALMAAG